MSGKSVIIIGSGFGGLIAGNLLAKKGHDVTIFESHTAPGGYTAGFYRKGFYFESGTLSFEASASIFKAMKDIGVFDDIAFSKETIRWVSKYFDSIPHSYYDFKKMVYEAFADEAEWLSNKATADFFYAKGLKPRILDIYISPKTKELVLISGHNTEADYFYLWRGYWGSPASEATFKGPLKHIGNLSYYGHLR